MVVWFREVVFEIEGRLVLDRFGRNRGRELVRYGVRRGGGVREVLGVGLCNERGWCCFLRSMVVKGSRFVEFRYVCWDLVGIGRGKSLSKRIERREEGIVCGIVDVLEFFRKVEFGRGGF